MNEMAQWKTRIKIPNTLCFNMYKNLNLECVKTQGSLLYKFAYIWKNETMEVSKWSFRIKTKFYS